MSNLHGGLMGGISTGLPIVARLFIRPTPSIAKSQHSINLGGQETTVSSEGRHDPCLAPRLGPVAEAMALICLADFYLEPNRYYVTTNQAMDSAYDYAPSRQLKNGFIFIAEAFSTCSSLKGDYCLMLKQPLVGV